jgi:hypothetical protein
MPARRRRISSASTISPLALAALPVVGHRLLRAVRVAPHVSAREGIAIAAAAP